MSSLLRRVAAAVKPPRAESALERRTRRLTSMVNDVIRIHGSVDEMPAPPQRLRIQSLGDAEVDDDLMRIIVAFREWCTLLKSGEKAKPQSVSVVPYNGGYRITVEWPHVAASLDFPMLRVLPIFVANRYSISNMHLRVLHQHVQGVVDVSLCNDEPSAIPTNPTSGAASHDHSGGHHQ